jgi:hypothetical protein
MLNVTTGTSVIVPSLQPYIYYEFKILAYTVEDGNSFETTPITNRSSQAAPYTPPLNVAVVPASPTQITVTWMPPSIVGANGIVTSYKVTYQRVLNQSRADPAANSTYQTDVGNVLTFTQSGLEEDIAYDFTVLAVTVADGVNSAAMRATTDQSAPDMAPAVTLSGSSSTSILASWVNPTPPSLNGPIAGYFVSYQRSSTTTWTDGTVITDSDFMAADSMHSVQLPVQYSLDITGLVPHMSYNISVRAFNMFKGNVLNGTWSPVMQVKALQAGLWLLVRMSVDC